MKKHLPYWIFAILAGLAMFGSGIFNLMRPPEIVENYHNLGYPEFMPLILGPAKILGAIGILVPKFPAIKEWAYAGSSFVLTGAIISHLLNGDPAQATFAPVIPLLLVLVSYYFFRKKSPFA